MTSSWQSADQDFPVRVMLTEAEIARDFAAAIEQRYLDEKFFYWLPLSVQAWVDLGSAPAYRNADRALQVLTANAARLADLWPDARVLCGVGCGDGSKDEALLRGFAHKGRRLRYVAADFSESLLEMACRRALAAGCGAEGVKFDVTSASQLASLARIAAGNGGAIFAVLGNTLGAFDPTGFPARLQKVMRPGDRTIFDGEVFAGEETLRGYDHPVNRRFAFSPLAGLGLEEGRDGKLVFELSSARAGEGLHEVVKYFVPARDLRLNVAGRELGLKKGELLRMSGSVKYDETAFFRLIEDGGFRVELRAKSEDGKFLLAGARPEG